MADVRRLNQQEIVRISQIISVHFRIENGVWNYERGWDDERVQKEVRIPGVTSKHVRNLRRSAFGRTVLEAAPRRVLEERVADLEKRVTALEDIFTKGVKVPS